MQPSTEPAAQRKKINPWAHKLTQQATAVGPGNGPEQNIRCRIIPLPEVVTELIRSYKPRIAIPASMGSAAAAQDGNVITCST